MRSGFWRDIKEGGFHARNQIRIGQAEQTFTRLTTPTQLQARALELLDIKLHK